MNLATIVTGLRIVLAPLFYFLFTTSSAPGTMTAVRAAALVILFLVIEITDVLDGMVARATGTVSDFGKLFDPFADSLARLTYFLAFVVAGAMPGWVFMLVLYRDLGVSFVRILSMKKGVAMSAQLSGKIKAWVYAVAGGAGMIAPMAAAWLPGPLANAAAAIAQACFYACAATAVWTMADYMAAYRRIAPKG